MSGPALVAAPARLSASGHTPRRTGVSLAPLPPQPPPQQQHRPLEPWTEDLLLETLAADQQRMVLTQYYHGDPPAGMSVLRSGAAMQVSTARGSQVPAATPARHEACSLLHKEREIQRLRGVRVGIPSAPSRISHRTVPAVLPSPGVTADSKQPTDQLTICQTACLLGRVGIFRGK